MTLVRATLTARFSGSKLFWRARTWVWRLRFDLGRLGLGVINRTASSRERFSAQREVAIGAGRAAVGAVAVVAGLWALQTWRFDILEFLHLDKGWLEEQASRTLNGSAYDTALQTLAGIAGIFLALYLGFVSTVAATVYTAVPHDIRNLMLRDKVGNSYVQLVALLTAVAGLLSIGRAAGSSPWIVAIPLLAVLTLFAIYAFVRLGQRAFYFFDPTILATRLETEFRRWARNAAADRYRASDASFQNHYRARARSAADSFLALVRISTRQETVDVEPLERLSYSVVRTLQFYVGMKHEIPIKSLWFGQRLRHKQWFLASASELAIANPTYTSLQPERVPDTDWVEESFLSAQVEVLGAHLHAKRGEAAATLLARLAGPVETMARSGSFAESMTWAAQLVQTSTDATLMEAQTDPVEQRDAVAVLDTACTVLIAVELGLLKRIKQSSLGPLRQRMESPREVRRVATDYAFPPRVTNYLETIADSLAFEIETRLPVRTAPWFVTEWGLNHFALALEADAQSFRGHQVWLAGSLTTH